MRRPAASCRQRRHDDFARVVGLFRRRVAEARPEAVRHHLDLSRRESRMFWGSLSSSTFIRIRIAAHAVFGVHTASGPSRHNIPIGGLESNDVILLHGELLFRGEFPAALTFINGTALGVDAQEHPALRRAHEAPARAPVKQPGRVGRAAPEKRSSTAARTGEIDKGDCANAYRGDTRERRLQDAAVDGAVGRRARAGGRSGRRADLRRPRARRCRSR